MRRIFLFCVVALTAISNAHAEQDSAEVARRIFQRKMQAQSAAQTGPNRYNNYSGRGSGRVNQITAQSGSVATTAPVEDTINQGASAGGASQGAGAMINAAVGAALMGACLSPCPRCNMTLCAMGALSFQQALADSAAAKESAFVFDQSKLNEAQPDAAATGAGEIDNSAYQAGLAKLSEAGYKVSGEGITFPDGSLKTPADFGSAGAMTAAGMDPSAIRDAQKVMSVLNQEASKINGLSEYSVASVGVAEGGGGGGGSSGGNNSDTLDSYGGVFGRDPGLKKAIDCRQDGDV